MIRRVRSSVATLLRLTALMVPVLACPGVAPAAFAFADFTAVTPTTSVPGSGSATGTLNGVAFTLTSTFASPRSSGPDSGGIIGGVTNGTSTRFGNSSYFSPSQALGDDVLLGGASDFKLVFASAVTDVTIHIAQLESNTLSFTSGGSPVAFVLDKSDGDLTASAGNTKIQGSPGHGDDANGSLRFVGTFTEISWTALRPVSGNTLQDGYWLQLSVSVPDVVGVPAPAGWVLVAGAAPLLLGRRLAGRARCRPA